LQFASGNSREKLFIACVSFRIIKIKLFDNYFLNNIKVKIKLIIIQLFANK